MADIVANRLTQNIEASSFVIMKKPPSVRHPYLEQRRAAFC